MNMVDDRQKKLMFDRFELKNGSRQAGDPKKVCKDGTTNWLAEVTVSH